MSSPSLVLVTGGNGFVGYAVLVGLLKEGYHRSFGLKVSIQRGRNFLLCSHTPTGPVMMDAADIVRRELPQEVADGKIPFVGKMDVITSNIDATLTERDLLGHPFRSFEEQVKDAINWYVRLED